MSKRPAPKVTPEQLADDRRWARCTATVLCGWADVPVDPDQPAHPSVTAQAMFRQTRGPAHEADMRAFMWAMMRRNMPGVSTERIGRAMGYVGFEIGKHRTTVEPAIYKIEELCGADVDLDAHVAKLADITRQIRELHAPPSFTEVRAAAKALEELDAQMQREIDEDEDEQRAAQQRALEEQKAKRLAVAKANRRANERPRKRSAA